MTPLVSSLALTCEETPAYLRAFPGDSADRQNTPKGCDTHTHIEIEERVHLVLNDGDGLEQLLCIHGPHHAVHSAWRRRETE